MAPRHDAPPARKDSNAQDLQRRLVNKIQTRTTPRNNLCRYPYCLLPAGVLTVCFYLSNICTVRVSFQRRLARPRRHEPHLECVVGRPRHDTLPVGKHGNAIDLQRMQIIKKVQQEADAARLTSFVCPSSVATHLPVATSHTLSWVSNDPETTRRPSGNTATQMTCNEDTSQMFDKWRQRAAPHKSALSASPRIRRSRRPTP